MVHGNILSAIGNTPLVRINHLCPHENIRIYAKVEGFNPTGSIKDRIAYFMLFEAQKNGELCKGKTIIEATSGNTGISIAMIGKVLGYPVEIVMSEAVSVERRQMIKAFGANVILTPAAEGTDGAIRYVRNKLQTEGESYFCTDQFTNKYNKLAHYKTTASEIYRQTGGEITHFVSSIGTSGTIMGVGQGLKENNPDIQIIEAQPIKGHYIQGLKNMEEAIIPALYDKSKIDRSIMVESEAAFECARDIVAKEGLFVGMSSGAAMYAALQAAEDIAVQGHSATMVVIFPDRGEKYLSTKLFSINEDKE